MFPVKIKILSWSKFTISLDYMITGRVDIDFEIGHSRNFQTSLTFTFSLDRVTWHTVVYHSLTFIYIPNFIEIGKKICGRTNGCWDWLL